MPAGYNFDVANQSMFSIFVNGKMEQWRPLLGRNGETLLSTNNTTTYESSRFRIVVPIAQAFSDSVQLPQHYNINVAIYSNSYKMVKHWPIYAGLDLGD